MVLYGLDVDSLSEEQKHEVISVLQESLLRPIAPEVEAEIEQELLARRKAHKEGRLKMLSVDEVLNSI